MNYCLFAVDRRGRRWRSGGFRFLYSVFVCVKMDVQLQSKPIAHHCNFRTNIPPIPHYCISVLHFWWGCLTARQGCLVQLWRLNCFLHPAWVWMLNNCPTTAWANPIISEPDKLLWRLRHSGETIWPQAVHLMSVDEDIFSKDIIVRQAANTHQCSL